MRGGCLAEKGRVYRCNICGNVVHVLEAGAGELVCCGEPMELLGEGEAKAYRKK